MLCIPESGGQGHSSRSALGSPRGAKLSLNPDTLPRLPASFGGQPVPTGCAGKKLRSMGATWGLVG